MIDAVSLAEERLARRPHDGVCRARACPPRWPGRQKWRRSCAAPAPSPTRAARAPSSVSSWISAPARRSSITSTAPSFALRPGRGRHPGPHDPHQELPADRAARPSPEGSTMFETAVREAVDTFVAEYHAYFARHNARQQVPKRELDPMPRVILVPGLGLVRARAQCPGRADRGRHRRVRRSRLSPMPRRSAGSSRSAKPTSSRSNIGRSSRRSSARVSEKPLAGQVAVVTGGAGTIGLATARAMSGAGAEIVLLDIARRASRSPKARRGGARASNAT